MNGGKFTGGCSNIHTTGSMLKHIKMHSVCTTNVGQRSVHQVQKATKQRNLKTAFK